MGKSTLLVIAAVIAAIIFSIWFAARDRANEESSTAQVAAYRSGASAALAQVATECNLAVDGGEAQVVGTPEVIGGQIIADETCSPTTVQLWNLARGVEYGEPGSARSTWVWSGGGLTSQILILPKSLEDSAQLFGEEVSERG